MNRPFIFLSGEFRITMPLAFSREHWQHTQSSRILELNSDGSFHRQGRNETLLGCIYHASISDETLRRQNLQFLIDNNIPTYPDPRMLIDIDDRHVCLRMCVDADLVSHKTIQGEYGTDISIPYPFVVKTGNDHQGQGKYLVSNASELPKWDGIATIEPFFEGVSCRVLWIGDDWFPLKYENDESWIKNSSGAELSLFHEMPQGVVEHSKRVKELFGLDVCGIDYIVVKDGWWFLEYNMFPGLDVDDNITSIVNSFFLQKMDWVEQQTHEV